MSQSIYLLVIGKGFTEAWHQLSEAEQNSLKSEMDEVHKRARGKWLILCNSRWADEEVFDWGVVEYPDMEANLKRTEELEALGWFRYFSARTILGTKFPEPWE